MRDGGAPQSGRRQPIPSDLRPKHPPRLVESLGLIWWPYAASLSMVIFSANSCCVRFPNAEWGLWVL